MPGVLEVGIIAGQSVLRELDDVVPGDGHVDLAVAGGRARHVDISVRAGGHVAPVRLVLAPCISCVTKNDKMIKNYVQGHSVRTFSVRGL